MSTGQLIGIVKKYKHNKMFPGRSFGVLSPAFGTIELLLRSEHAATGTDTSRIPVDGEEIAYYPGKIAGIAYNWSFVEAPREPN